MPNDYYKVLQVDPEADPDVIQAAYQALAARLSPASDLTGVHIVRMRDLNRAFETLSHPGRRRAYDIERSAAYGPMAPGELIGIPIQDPAPEPVAAGASRGLRARLDDATARAGANGYPDAGAAILDFGRFAGRSLREVAREDTEYLRWLSRHSSGIRYRGDIEKVLRGVGEAL